jgi:predicted 3-demethylubiquinone-9 3-methyltransferase (glyoxalase superfamily)
MPVTTRITPCLWFDTRAEEAARFYVSIFPGSGIDHVSRYGKAGFEVHGKPAGSVMTVAFHLGSQPVVALNGGPQFRFTEAVSLQVLCDGQEEVDQYWARLADGGEEGPCGWLKDRFGLSWQVIPTALGQMLGAPDSPGAEAAFRAMLQMRKLDLAALRRAFDAATP